MIGGPHAKWKCWDPLKVIKNFKMQEEQGGAVGAAAAAKAVEPALKGRASLRPNSKRPVVPRFLEQSHAYSRCSLHHRVPPSRVSVTYGFPGPPATATERWWVPQEERDAAPICPEAWVWSHQCLAATGSIFPTPSDNDKDSSPDVTSPGTSSGGGVPFVDEAPGGPWPPYDLPGVPTLPLPTSLLAPTQAPGLRPAVGQSPLHLRGVLTGRPTPTPAHCCPFWLPRRFQTKERSTLLPPGREVLETVPSALSHYLLSGQWQSWWWAVSD